MPSRSVGDAGQLSRTAMQDSMATIAWQVGDAIGMGEWRRIAWQDSDENIE